MYFYWVLYFFVFACLVLPQEKITVSAEGTCFGANITPEEGYQKALENARSEAIRQAVGVEINEEIFRNVLESDFQGERKIIDVFVKLSQSASSGRIVKEELEKKIETVYGIPVYTVKIQADVLKETELPDPAFSAEIILPKDVYYDRGGENSDILTFDLSATEDCFFYLFNIMANDTVQLIFPNKYISDNHYEKNKEKQEYEKALERLTFFVSIPEYRQQATEALYLVALKDKIDFKSDNYGKDRDGVISTYKAAITDIQKWLLKIPRDRRTETTQIFEIRKVKR